MFLRGHLDNKMSPLFKRPNVKLLQCVGICDQ